MYNPMIHRLNDAVRRRALFPEQPMPEIPKTLLRFATPVDELLSRARYDIDALVEAAEVKKGMSNCLITKKILCDPLTPIAL